MLFDPWRCEQQMIGECYQISICRHITWLVISTWIGDNCILFIYLFLFFLARDVGSVALLENACCLVAEVD
jgi:hypothetical protein